MNKIGRILPEILMPRVRKTWGESIQKDVYYIYYV